MFRVLIFPALILLALGLNAQCPLSSFSLKNPSNVCINSEISIINQSSNVAEYYWDFCPEDFTESPNIISNSLSGISNVYGFKLIQDNGNWYGFAVLRSANKVIRLDYGQSLEGTPVMFDLGNPSGLLASPEGIDIVNDNGNWFGFVGKGENSTGQIVRLEFGSSITNIPSGTGLGSFSVGAGRYRDLKIINQGGDYVLLVLYYNGNSLNRVNFGSSLANNPTSGSIVSIVGSSLPRSFSISSFCDSWILHVVSENGLVQQISFGSDIFGAMTVEGGYTFPSIQNPWRIVDVFTAGKHYSIVSSNNLKFSIIDFDDLSLSTPPVVIQQDQDVKFISFDVARYNGELMICGGSSSSVISTISYVKPCQASIAFSVDAKPKELRYLSGGMKKIDVRGSTTLNKTYASMDLSVSSVQASDIEIISDKECVNAIITYSVNSDNQLNTWDWDFGDMTTSTDETPMHSYSSIGSYELTLDVIDNNNCGNHETFTQDIFNAPISDFDLPVITPLCSNQSQRFDNMSLYDLSSNPDFTWEVNSIVVSTSMELNYNFPSASSYDISLTTSIPGCTDKITKTINIIEEGPLADFSFINDCEDKSIAFTNTTVGAVTGYSWDFGDGNTSGLTDGANTFDNFGTYDVTLEATNAAGCINTSVQEITIYSKPQPDFSLDLPPFSCSGSPSQFNDLTPNPSDSNLDSWTWSFGDTQSGTSAVRNPQYIYTDAGQYDVNLDVTTNYGCTTSVQKMVTISESPDASFTFNAACVNQAAAFVPLSTSGIDSWQWKIGASTYSQQNPTHVFSAPSNYNVQLTANGSNGCIGVTTQTISVPVPSTVDFGFENNCTNQDTQFTDLTLSGTDPVSSRFWQFGTIGSASGATPSFKFPTAGSYPIKLTVTNESGCSYSTTKIVNIAQSPVATFTATPQTGTPPLTVQLNNTSNNSVSQLWSINDPNNTTSTEKTTSFTFDTLGEYVVDLTIQDESGCSSVSSKIISVIIPSLDIELTNLLLIPSSTGESNILLTLTNKSNFPVNNIKAVVDIAGEALISEALAATIQPGEVYSQVLSAGIIESKNGTAYLCVELVVDGDADTANNKRCLNNDIATIVLAPYPNPVSESLNLEWVSSVSGSAELHIFDPTGRKVYEDVFSDLEPGLNKTTISVSLLNPGMYYVFFVSEGVRRSFPFVIRR